MTEFSQNATIFRQALMPWLVDITNTVGLVRTHHGQIVFLSSRLLRLRGQLTDLEQRANELEIKAQRDIILVRKRPQYTSNHH